MFDLREHIGEVVLGFFVLLLRLFGKKSEAEKLSASLKKWKKRAKKHGKQLENDLAHIDKLKKEE